MSTSFTLEEIISRCFPQQCTIVGDKDILINGVADLASATPHQLSFFSNARYSADLKKSLAAAIIIAPDKFASENVPDNKTYLLHDNPSAAFQAVLNLFHEGETPRITEFYGIHPTAVIHPTAQLGKNVSVGPYAVIDAYVIVGEGTQILPHAYIARKSSIGASCIIHAHAVIREECCLGDRVIVQPGAVIGSCGFGYATDKKGAHSKLAHWGNVVLESDVEIGANTTIDRARFASTKVGMGTKIDNLVQLGHNVQIGKHAFIVSQVGVAGSTTIGNHTILAGKAAVNGHIALCDGVVVAACSAVTKSIKEPGKYSGIPVQKVEDHNKNAVYLRKVPELFQKVKVLEAIVEKMNMK